MAKKDTTKGAGSAIASAVLTKPNEADITRAAEQGLRDAWQETAAGAIQARDATLKVKSSLTKHLRAVALSLVPLYISGGTFKAAACAKAFGEMAGSIAREMQDKAPPAKNGKPQAVKKLHPSWMVTVSQVSSLVERSEKAPTAYASPEVWAKENAPERGASGGKRQTAATIKTIVGQSVTPKAEASLMAIMNCLKQAGQAAMPEVEKVLATAHHQIADIIAKHPAATAVKAA